MGAAPLADRRAVLTRRRTRRGGGEARRDGQRPPRWSARGTRCDCSGRGRRCPAPPARRDLDAGVEVTGEAADHEALLGVLLPEVGAVGPAAIRSLATTSATPSKCPGRCSPLETPVIAAHLHRGRIHPRTSRRRWDEAASTRSAASMSRSWSRERGKRRCPRRDRTAGLTKMLTTTRSQSARARRGG